MLPLNLCRYLCSLSFFHYSEYLVTAIINPRSLTLDSFLLNHSLEYTLAAVSSWMEFTVEKLTVPGWCLLISTTELLNYGRKKINISTVNTVTHDTE